MKTLLVSNRKGGVGKSAIVCQFAHFLQKKSYKVLVLDFDHQGDTSNALNMDSSNFKSDLKSIDIFIKEKNLIDFNPSTLVIGTDELRNLERNVIEHNQYLINLKNFLNQCKDYFDYCLIDTNPSPDIRQISSMIVADYVLSPIQLNQEAVNGIAGIFKQIRTYKKLNSKLEFLGVLPNFVEKTPFQKENFELIKQHYPTILIKSDNDFISIPKSSAIAEAQAQGIPCNKLKKTQGYDISRSLNKVFNSILEKIEAK